MPRQKLIAQCTPSLGKVSIWWAKQITQLLWPMNIAKRNDYIRDERGGIIAECRNRLVADTLALEEHHDCEIDSIFWVDDDVLVMRGALLRLYSHHKPIVSGVYFSKEEVPQPLIFPSKLGGTSKFVPGKVIEAWAHGMGLCLVKAEVYKAMLAAGLPTDAGGNPQWYKTNREYTIKEGTSFLDCGGTEDMHFLDRAAELGYKPIVDCTPHAFGFHYDIEQNIGYPIPQYNQWASRKPITWETDDGLVTWE